MLTLFMLAIIAAWLLIALAVWALLFYWHLIVGLLLIYVGVRLVAWSRSSLAGPRQ